MRENKSMKKGRNPPLWYLLPVVIVLMGGLGTTIQEGILWPFIGSVALATLAAVPYLWLSILQEDES